MRKENFETSTISISIEGAMSCVFWLRHSATNGRHKRQTICWSTGDVFARTLSVSKAKFLHFCRDRDGSLAPVFALMLTPMLIAVGASVDYSRANSIKSTLQATPDAAVLAGAKVGVTSGGSDWSQLAQNIFQSNLAVKHPMAATPTFTVNNATEPILGA